jgi:DNA-binding SARP family transcriptional activator
MELDRNFGESHGALAAVQVLQGKIDEARASIKRAQRLNPLGFAAYYAQMLLLEADGKGEEAKQLVESIMKTPHLNLGTTPEELVKKRLLELSKGMTKH